MVLSTTLATSFSARALSFVDPAGIAVEAVRSVDISTLLVCPRVKRARTKALGEAQADRVALPAVKQVKKIG